MRVVVALVGLGVAISLFDALGLPFTLRVILALISLVVMISLFDVLGLPFNMHRSIVVLVGLGLAISLLGVLGFRFNLTESLAVGVYRVTSTSPTRGAIVKVCLPWRVAEFARERGYLGPGRCPGRVRPMGKVVLATQGDVVRLEPEGIRVNGEVVANSPTTMQDRHGRPVPHHPWGVYRLRPGEFWLFSEHRSAYDSRYFGPVHKADVVAVLRPVWTWR